MTKEQYLKRKNRIDIYQHPRDIEDSSLSGRYVFVNKDDVRIKHLKECDTGYYTDEYGDEWIKGSALVFYGDRKAVYEGVLSSYNDDIRVDIQTREEIDFLGCESEWEAHDDVVAALKEAARGANRQAELDAEAEREYNRRWQAAATVADNLREIDDIKNSLKELRGDISLVDRRLSHARRALHSDIRNSRHQIKSLKEDNAKLINEHNLTTAEINEH